MQDSSSSERTLTNLRLEYQAAWHRFLIEVNKWQALERDPEADITSILAAESAARLAEEEYRQVRNALADCLLESSLCTSQLVA